MQGMPATAAGRKPVERAKAETDVRVLHASVDDLAAEHAKEAESYKRWQTRCTHAENADVLLEYTIHKSRSAVKLGDLADSLKRCNALLASAREELHKLDAIVPAPAGGLAAPARAPVAADDAAARAPAGGPAAPAQPPVAAVCTAAPLQAGGPTTPAFASVPAVGANAPAPTSGPDDPARAPVAAVGATAPGSGGGPAVLLRAVGAAHADAASSGRELSAILKDVKKIPVSSPTSDQPTILRYPLAALSMRRPLTVPTSLPDEWYAAKVRGGCADKTSLGEEAACYTKATAFLPAWVERVAGATSGGSRTACQLYGISGESVNDCPFVKLPWACKPDLLMTSKRGWPGWDGEIKSCPAVTWDEIVLSVCCSMVNSMFPPSLHNLLFHFDPPYGYGVMGMADPCFIVALEWVGRLFVTPISIPFILESPEHKAQVDALKGDQVQHCVELSTVQPGVLWKEFPIVNSTRHVIWTCTPAELRIVPFSDEGKEPTIIRNRFIKVLTCTARGSSDAGLSNRRWRELHKVYKMYGSVLAAAPKQGPGCLPSALLPAELLYGYFSVMVHMPFQLGREAVDVELESGPIVQQLSEAIVWLAWRGLLYYDVRTPNVIVRCDGASTTAVLVDYDDLVIVEQHTVNTFDKYVAALASATQDLGEKDVTGGLLAVEGLCAHLDTELRKEL